MIDNDLITKEMAYDLGFSCSYVSNIISGEAPLSKVVYEKLCDTYDINEEYKNSLYKCISVRNIPKSLYRILKSEEQLEFLEWFIDNVDIIKDEDLKWFYEKYKESEVHE
jgi:transcriptional regulator with XRE-family HTH domain